MDANQMRGRTKQSALCVSRLVQSLPKEHPCDVIARQLLRSGIAVGASYRAACRAKSCVDFISKMDTVEEEVDESSY